MDTKDSSSRKKRLDQCSQMERGETGISGCSFKNCKPMLKGNSYTVGEIIKLFTGKSPLKVLDMEEPSTPSLPFDGGG
jgi:hypothetical protein